VYWVDVGDIKVRVKKCGWEKCNFDDLDKTCVPGDTCLRVCLVSVPRNENKNKNKFDGIRTVPAVAKLSNTMQCLSVNHWELIASSPPPPQETWQWQLLLAAAYVINVICVATTLYASPLYWKQDYHTSKLSGGEWVEELIYSLKTDMRQVIT